MARGLTKKMDLLNHPCGEERLKLWNHKTRLSMTFPPQEQALRKWKEFVRNNAWGHHASCTCAIGPRNENGVLDTNFQVHGTQGLRVVDASVFPQIPGVFIVSAIYMIAEKAADVILAAQ